MIEHIVLFKLRPDMDAEDIDQMMRETRLRLLKISCVLAVRCGKNIDPASEWPFFLSVVLDSPAKLPVYAADPIHVKFVDEVIRPNTTARLALDFRTTPGDDLLFS